MTAATAIHTASIRRQLAGERGNALIFALVTVLIVSLLTALAYNRVTRSDSRSGQARNQERAQRAADTAVELAFKRVQVTGSADFDEHLCSSLDEPGPAAVERDDAGGQVSCTPGTSRKPNINGYTAADGSYGWTVTGSGLERTVTATGTFTSADGKLYSAKRTQTFLITPRVFRYALFASGGSGTGSAAEIGAGASVLLPPTYKTVPEPFVRGGDLGANGPVSVPPNGSINVRDADTSGLYDKFFVNGTASSDAGDFYGGAPWGYMYTSANGASALSTGHGTALPQANVNFDHAGSGPSPRSQTSLPGFDGLLKSYRTQAQVAVTGDNPTGNDPSTTGGLYTPAEFQALVDGTSTDTQQFRGLIYVAQAAGDETRCPDITISRPVLIDGGGLVTVGCDVTVAPTGSLTVKHPMERNDDADTAADSVAGNPTDDDSDDPDYPRNPAAVHKLPGLMVLADANYGGDFTSRATGAAGVVSIDGVTYVEHNLEITSSAAALPSGLGNFNANGSVVVGGEFRAHGSGSGKVSVLLRWNALAQWIGFDQQRMGTYTVRANDRVPTGKPTVDIIATPESPGSYKGTDSFSRLDPTFGWQPADNYDIAECTHTWGTSATDSNSVTGGGEEKVSCSGALTKTYALDGTERNRFHRFTITVCNLNYRDDDDDPDTDTAQRQQCGEDSYTWFITPTPPDIKIDNASKPANPTKSSSVNGFTWTLAGNPDANVTCSLDGADLAACAEPKPYEGLGYGAHTFKVHADDSFGAKDNPADTDTYTWTVQPPSPPTVTITNNSTTNTNATDATVNWITSAGATIRDDSGNGNHGTARAASAVLSGQFRQAGVNSGSRSVFFDGAGDMVQLGNGGEFQRKNGTLSAWIKTTETNAVQGVITKQAAYGVFVYQGRLQGFDWGAGEWRDTGVTVADGAWHHVAMTFSSGTAQLFVDGVQRGGSFAYSISGQSIGAVIGNGSDSDGSGQSFKGNIDNAAVIPGVLTGAQVKAIYDNRSSDDFVKRFDPLGLYKLDDEPLDTQRIDRVECAADTADTGIVSEAQWTACWPPKTNASDAVNAKTWTGLTRNTRYRLLVRVCNAGGCNQAAYGAFKVNPLPPTIQFTAGPANPSAYNVRQPVFSARVTNSVPVTGWECYLDGSGWFACNSSYQTWALDNNGVNGVTHDFYMRAYNDAGYGPQIRYGSGWTIYPDPIPGGHPYWGAYPPAVDYDSGGSQGWFESAGARNLECYDAAHGYWYGCANGNVFAAGYYCSDNFVQIRAYNVTSGYVYGAATSFHRNCEPPTANVYLGDHNGAGDMTWRATYYPTSQGYISGCDLLATWPTYGQTWGCPGNGGWLTMGGHSCMALRVWATANDGTRTTAYNTGEGRSHCG